MNCPYRLSFKGGATAPGRHEKVVPRAVLPARGFSFRSVALSGFRPSSVRCLRNKYQLA